MSASANQVACQTVRDGILASISRFLEPLLDLWQVLLLCRFSVLTLIVAFAFLIWSSQGQEILILLQTLQEGWMVQNCLFLASVIAWAWAVWYWSRVIVSFRFPHWPPPDASKERRQRICAYNRVMPGILGALTFVTIAAGFAWSLRGRNTLVPMLGNSGAYLVCAAIFLRFIRKRQAWAARWRERYPWTNRLLLDPHPAAQDPPFEALYLSQNDVPNPIWRALKVSFLTLTIIPFLVFLIRESNQVIAPLVGPAFIVLLAAASWVPLGTMVVYWSNWHRIPILSLLLLYAALISMWNDNHTIRTIARNPAILSPPQSIEEHFMHWVQRRFEERIAPQDPVPVFLVAAEGGGIRGAYWTATVLARIQKDRPDFGPHVFLISGVSGGGLGAALFAALNADQGSDSPCASPMQFLPCTRTILQRDFLSPTLGTLFYPDLFQRFLFLPFPYLDRGRTLEESWEKAWHIVTDRKSARFSEPIENLWRGPQGADVPSLILNMTSVEQGNRVLMSNLRIVEGAHSDICVESWTRNSTGPFQDALDLSQAINMPECEGSGVPNRAPSTLRLSTAVNNSSRFSFISPAGRVNSRLHLVDGGYFEVSGMTTLEEALYRLTPLAEIVSREIGTPILPIVLHIKNEPILSTIGVQYIGPLYGIAPNAPLNCIRIIIVDGSLQPFRNNDDPCPGSANAAAKESVIAATESVREKIKPGSHTILLLNSQNVAVGVVEASSQFLNELFAPLITMYRSQSARGKQVVQRVERQIRDRHSHVATAFIPFELRKNTATLPLGWKLGPESTREMDLQLETYFQSDMCGKNPNESLIEYVKHCWPHLSTGLELEQPPL